MLVGAIAWRHSSSIRFSPPSQPGGLEVTHDGHGETTSSGLGSRRVLDLVDVSGLADMSAVLSARRSIADLPGPKGFPVVGNALQLRRSHLHEIIDDWAAEFGPMYTFRLGPQRTVVVADPALFVQILKDRPDTYRRISKIHSVILEMGMEGPFSAEGSAWRQQRRLAMDAISNRQMPAFYPTMRTVAAR